MRRRTALLPPVLLLIAALLLGACGGGDDAAPTKAEYGRELRSTMKTLDESYPQAGADAAGADLPATRAAFSDAATKLEAIEAPPELADEHAELVDGVRGMAESITTLEEARRIAKTDPTRAKVLLREFADDPSARKVTEATAALENAGIDTGA